MQATSDSLHVHQGKIMKKNNTETKTSGKLSDASPCSSRFYAGAIVSHKLNNIKGIITSEGTLRNGGQCWNVRFERDNYFEELEVWEHELFLPRTAPPLCNSLSERW